jgi:hypothetical protein
MAIDPTALRAEVLNDPKTLGYKPFVNTGNDAAILDILNSLTGPGAEIIELPFVSRDDFLKAMRPAYFVLPKATSEVRDKWDRILNAINSGPGVTIDDQTKQLLGSAVQDGVLTQAQADAAWHRIGSRAEVLFGVGAVPTTSDLSYALRGVR